MKKIIFLGSIISLLYCIQLIRITDGKANWAEVYPKHCAGSQQSPVDILEWEAVHETSLKMDPFKFSETYSYIPESMLLVNDGKQVNILMDDDKRRELWGGGLEGVYIFHAAHFHYGPNVSYGAEHLHNGHRYPSEVHLVHYRAEYLRYEAAKLSDRRDAIAVLATWIEPTMGSHTNDDYPDIFRRIDDAKQLEIDKKVKIKPFDIMRLIPHGDKHDDFFRYFGSLTTPPCTEVVVWTIFRTPLHVPKYRVRKMFNLMVNLSLMTPEDQDYLFRDVQPLNGRTIIKSQNY